MTAYILVKLAHSADISKARHSLQQPGVKSVDLILGPWDALVRCEADSVEGVGRLAQQVRSCPGVTDSLTCPVI